MKIADMKVTELINAVGSDAPAPGGGAVAGLAGGIGVALTMMVNGLTLSKKGFEDDRERILDAIAKGNELKERFVDVMNRDSEVFDCSSNPSPCPRRMTPRRPFAAARCRRASATARRSP